MNKYEVMETIRMIDEEKLDIRTITMGISLMDCIGQNVEESCNLIYEKIVRSAENLVSVGQDIEMEYGIPIINKRISVTPISIIAAPCRDEQDCLKYAHI